MVVDEKNDREVYKVGKVFTKEWRKAEVLKLDFLCFFLQSLFKFWTEKPGSVVCNIWLVRHITHY